ncbi:MAG TPA: HutD family protein [Rhodanobacteraceae bacterium]
MSRLVLLRTSDYRRVRWKNDGGWTTEIAREPAGAETQFAWRVSIADIESDGPFSSFPGVDRDLVLLAGAGMELSIDDAAPLRVDERFQHVRFRGEQVVECRLLGGSTRDFNAMVRRGAMVAEVIARPLVGSMVIFPQVGTEWLIHVHAGHATARDGQDEVSLSTGETLRIDFRHQGVGRIVLDGAGELVLVKFAPATARSDNG